MVAPGVVVASLTMTAPFCAAEVDMVGAAGLAGVGVEFASLPRPHPHIKTPDRTIAAGIVGVRGTPPLWPTPTNRVRPCAKRDRTVSLAAAVRYGNVLPTIIH